MVSGRLGIEYLCENHLLIKDHPQDVAQFLYKGEGLNKTAIGKIEETFYRHLRFII